MLNSLSFLKDSKISFNSSNSVEKINKLFSKIVLNIN